MCTVTIIELGHHATPHLAGLSGFRVVVNRDEQRDRLAAMSPRWRPVGDEARRAIWPIDPKGGGTWVGASESGLVLCLLNRNLEPAPELPGGLLSRGVIIPRLISSDSPEEALARLAEFDLDRFAPFRLVLAAPRRPTRHGHTGVSVREAVWDRDELSTRAAGPVPACFVSSGLGDSLVECRHDLFASLLASPTPHAQDAFHRHAWQGREHVSVMMARDDARTVSVTSVEVTPAARGVVGVRMSYLPVQARESRLCVAAAPRV